mgnify:FL=1|jgi:hypothetical protein
MVAFRSPATGPVVETVLLSAGRGRLWYRVRRSDLGAAVPDEVARRVSGLAAGEPAGLLHSTSWRFEAGRVVLTYVALPDAAPGPGLRPVPLESRSASAGPLAPSPVSVSMDDVAVHACRHLAYLRHTDPLVRRRAEAAPQLWALIDEFVPAVAGQLVQPIEPDARELAGGPVHVA